MASVKLSVVAGSAVLLSLNAAGAADLSLPPPPVPVVQEFSGWYLRGDIGFSNQKVKSIYNVLESDPGISVVTPTASFDAAPFFGLGIGYQYNNWLRFDATGEYRAGATFHGLQVVSFNGAPIGTDTYSATKSEWVGLANVYVDLGTWWCVTPFVGAGVGASYNRISNFVDSGIGIGPTVGTAYAADTGKWNLAWALHAGLAYKVTPNFTVELAYRYLNLGDGISGDLVTYTGLNTRVNPENFNTLTSHDLKLGVRWLLNAPEPIYPGPLVRKG